MRAKEEGKRKKAKVRIPTLTLYLLPFTFCLTILAAAPSTQPTAQVKTWFDQLADPSPTVREAAHHSLLGLSSADLPTLQRVVAASRPLKPNQRAVLMQIVQHVYISGIPYEPGEAGEGFLGVTFDFVTADLQTGERHGVIVTECELGFPAYRMLRPGDLVKGIEQIPGIGFESTEQFRAAIRSLRAGEKVMLLIEREGRPLRIAVELRIRPAGIETTEDIRIWRSILRERADTYWNENFSRLVEDGPA